jgi:hypothetical protein
MVDGVYPLPLSSFSLCPYLVKGREDEERASE